MALATRLSHPAREAASEFFSNVTVKSGLFAKGRDAGPILDVFGEKKLPTSIVVITDSNIIKLKAPSRLISAISKKAKTGVVTVRAGEKSKTFDQCSKILAHLSRLGLDRDGAVVLLGGGVVGDLGGFAASIYKRGVRYVQVPTTLIAQVDSSMGGKTGVDTRWGKNQVGTFYQPLGVLIDPDFLGTLPASEILNGVGEMVKYGIVASEGIFVSLERMDAFDSVLELAELIEPCCRIKMKVVSIDPHDRTIRSTLNYGHTVGHAIEAASDYSLGHGQSVLLGMICEGWIARELGIYDATDYARQQRLIGRILASQPESAKILKKDSDRKIVEIAQSDKKNVGKELRMSLPEKIGTMHANDGSYKTPVPKPLLKSSLGFLRKTAPSIFSTEK